MSIWAIALLILAGPIYLIMVAYALSYVIMKGFHDANVSNALKIVELFGSPDALNTTNNDEEDENNG